MPDWKIGADVSVYQGDVDWDLLKKVGRTSFAYIKTSEGYGFNDPKWSRNRAEADRVGMPWGGYHFARPNGGSSWEQDARDEARWFVDSGGCSGPLPGMLDLESSQLDKETTIRWAVTFCETANRLSGRSMTVLYVGYYFMGGGVAEDERLRHCPWWLAWYTSGYDLNPDPFTMRLPATNRGRGWDIWQYTSSGRDAGVAGNLDMNVMPRSLFDHLINNSWADPSQVPTPPTPPAQEEDDIEMKAVFTEQTGPVGWRASFENGKRFRVGYTDGADLQADLDAGLVTGTVELKGDAGQRFLDRYPDAEPYDGPRLVIRYANDSTWAREVAGLTGDESARFFFVPNRYTIRIANDDQWNVDKYLGVPEADLSDHLLWNQPLVTWNMALEMDGGIPALVLGDADKEDIAQRVAKVLYDRLKD